MISHVFIGITGYHRALVFYSALMDSLEMSRKFADADKGWAGWMAPDAPRPLFVIGKPFEGAHEAGNGQMVALLAKCNGTQAVAGLYQEVIKASLIPRSLTTAEFSSFLAAMVERGYLTLDELERG